MRNAPRPHRAGRQRVKPAAAARFRACLALLYAGETPTPERAAAIEREAAMAPYRGGPQGELKLEPVK